MQTILDGTSVVPFLKHLLKSSNHIPLSIIINTSNPALQAADTLQMLSQTFEHACHGLQGIGISTREWQPHLLLRAQILASVVGMKPDASLQDLSQVRKEAQGAMDVQRLLRNSLQQHSRRLQLVRLFFASIDAIRIVMESSIELVQQHPQSTLTATLIVSRQILERASTSANEEYRTVFCSTLMPQAYALLAAVEQGEYETELGKSMVALARSFWRLLIPNFPVDPVAVILHRGSFLADEIAGIDTSTHVDAESNVVFPAQSTPRIALLERWNDLLKVEAASLPVPPVSRLPQPALLFALFQDLHGFSKHVLHVDLSNALSPPALNDNSSEISRNLYASVQLFTQKLSQIYGYFDDILRPIFFCLSILQLGLSIVGNAPSRSTAQVQELVENILTFPTVAISIEDVDLPSLSGFPLMEWNLFRLGLCLRRQCNLPIVLDRSTILSAYTILHSEWLRLQDIQENEKQSKDSLYKMKTYDYLDSENDVDGQEFHDLFPAYDESDIDEPILPTPRKSIWWSEIWTIHSALFLGHQSQKAMRILEASRDAILQTVIQNSAVTFADSLDNLSLPYQTTRLHQWRRAMDGLNDETPDFYSEGNIRETSRAIACLRPLRQRLSSLLAEFPEQVVLEHLRDRCDDILRLYIDTPIMRILTKLEQLLLDLEDWEKYADKAHSLEYFRSDLIQLVLSWRRLELQSWSALLSKEEKNFNADLSDWFFRFYTIMSPAMESDVEPTKRLRETISLLRSFIADSNIGQYKGRNFGFRLHFLTPLAMSRHTTNSSPPV
ncbi:hypothetical protein BT69DRAFT_19694 [Atractiella rhizophila]|nr:hypothetical protein BT69DRAFT_19694 [Atractiella rhizophila]